MVASGKWRPGAACPPHVRGYHVNALVSPWVKWSELAEQYEGAKGFAGTSEDLHQSGAGRAVEGTAGSHAGTGSAGQPF